MKTALDHALPEVNLNESRFGPDDYWEALNDIEMDLISRRPLLLTRGEGLTALALDSAIVLRLLSPYLFRLTVNSDGGEITVGDSRFSVLGFGGDLQGAINDFFLELVDYTVEYFDQPDREPFDQDKYLTLLHFALTDAADWDELLIQA